MKNEWRMLQENHKNVTISDDMTHIEWVSPGSRKFTLELPQNYPFSPPVVYENGVPYKEKWKAFNAGLLNLYITRYGECGCVCCVVKVLGSEWAPAVTIDRVLNKLAIEEERWLSLYTELLEEHMLTDVANCIAGFL